VQYFQNQSFQTSVRNGVIVYKWRIVLGGVASACFLGTFAAGPAFASVASPERGSAIIDQAAGLPTVGQLVPGALNAVTALPPVAAVTGPVSSILSTLGQGYAPSGTPANLPDLTGVLPAVGAATGALLNGLGNTTQNLSDTLLPAVGPAVSGLTAPLDGLSQDIGNLSGVPVLGALVSGVPALPDTGDLIGDLNNLVNGAGHVGG
jgi:hypothetical protein